MYFNRVFITAEGYDLLGAATAGSSQENKTIIWENAITSSVDTSSWDSSRMNSATADDFPTNLHTSSGSVTSAVHNQKDVVVDNQTIKVDVVTVTVDINNERYNGIANTLCIFAKLNNGESKLVIVASADNPETVHPKESQPYNAILNLHIELSGTAVSEVSANSSWYATADAFNSLAGRVVTTHSEGLPTTGENQVIYGVKTFKNNVHTSNVTPLNNLTVNLGDSAHIYKNVFARTVNQPIMKCSTAAAIAAKLIVSEQTLNFGSPKAGDRILVNFVYGNSNATPTIKIDQGRDISEYTINGLRNNLEANSVVPMTFNGSSWDVDGASSVAKQIDLSVKSDSSDYSVVFTNVAATQLEGTPRNRELCIDPSTDVNLKYNPGTNTLSTDNLKCENLEVSGNFDLNYSALLTLAELFGIKLNLIRIYRATALDNLDITFSADAEVTFGEGKYISGSSIRSSNYTICGYRTFGQIGRFTYMPGTFRITKLISSGKTSSLQDALIDITINNVEYNDCADPDFGTPCVCLAIKLS